MLHKLKAGVSTLTNSIAAALLAAMFFTFLLQVGSRYTPQIVDNFGLSGRYAWLDSIEPLGWTLELCLILWVWIVFFGCAFNVREKDHVTFDIFYLAAPPGPRRIMALIASGAIVVGMAISFWPTWDYVDFMRMRRTSTVENPFTGDRIRLKWIFIIYMVFLGALVARYGWRFISTLRNGPPDDHHLIDDAAAHERAP
ncbi:TRAP transporter small permease [Jannaschia sp. CCS1]|uniref:TRAP transporter small permease n=1 Tax=Jannaschia sp. (strain CCS1) TaxID=290400 RepID=UPI000053BFB5|nr:TRAP transporter small permease subunit [Jannaschia sp. CCS1]ABD57054.1 TRAP dicarboxylate transporter DctQ subunit [Jannaschia sp. CCS1]